MEAQVLERDTERLQEAVRRLPVGGVGRVVLGEQALPVGLEGVVEGAPVPVHDAHRAGGQVGVGLETQLAGVGQPAHLPLGLGLDDEVGRAALEGAGDVPAEADLVAGQAVLAGVVDVDAGQGDGVGRLEVVDGALDAEGVPAPLVVEVLGDELVLAPVLIDQAALPGEEPGDEATTKGIRTARFGRGWPDSLAIGTTRYIESPTLCVRFPRQNPPLSKVSWRSFTTKFSS